MNEAAAEKRMIVSTGVWGPILDERLDSKCMKLKFSGATCLGASIAVIDRIIDLSKKGYALEFNSEETLPETRQMVLDALEKVV